MTRNQKLALQALENGELQNAANLIVAHAQAEHEKAKHKLAQLQESYKALLDDRTIPNGDRLSPWCSFDSSHT